MPDELFENIVENKDAKNKEPQPDHAMCSFCGWEGPIEECGTEEEGNWDIGYYTVHLCPECEDGGCIDDYTMSAERSKEWIKWCEENVKMPETVEGEIGFLPDNPA